MTTPYLRRYYAGGGTSTTLANAMGTFDGSFVITADTGWPGAGGYFVVVVDRGTASEEKIRCSGNSGTTVTVGADGNGGRGYDGTSATSHNSGATVSLCGAAIDFDEANQVVTQVLGQSGAAKGDILAMLSAAGPNTLTRVGIGSNSPVLGVAAGLPAWQQPRPSTTLSSGQSLAINQSYKISGGSGTYVLPAPVAGGFVIVTNYGSGVVTVSHNASEVIYGLGLTTSGASSFTLGAAGGGSTATVESDGTNWFITAGQRDTGWLPNPTYTNTAVSAGGPASGATAAGYRIKGNVVRLGGTVTQGGSNPQASFTMPVGARPTYQVNLTMLDTTGGTLATISVAANGVVTSTLAVQGQVFSIDNITYTID